MFIYYNDKTYIAYIYIYVYHQYKHVNKHG